MTVPPYCCCGLGNAPVGVTCGAHVEPPRWTSTSNELPERTMTSWASLCRKLNTSTLFTLMTESPAIKPAWSAILPMLTCANEQKWEIMKKWINFWIHGEKKWVEKCIRTKVTQNCAEPIGIYFIRPFEYVEGFLIGCFLADRSNANAFILSHAPYYNLLSRATYTMAHGTHKATPNSIIIFAMRCFILHFQSKYDWISGVSLATAKIHL